MKTFRKHGKKMVGVTKAENNYLPKVKKVRITGGKLSIVNGRLVRKFDAPKT